MKHEFTTENTGEDIAASIAVATRMLARMCRWGAADARVVVAGEYTEQFEYACGKLVSLYTRALTARGQKRAHALRVADRAMSGVYQTYDVAMRWRKVEEMNDAVTVRVQLDDQHSALISAHREGGSWRMLASATDGWEHSETIPHSPDAISWYARTVRAMWRSSKHGGMPRIWD